MKPSRPVSYTHLDVYKRQALLDSMELPYLVENYHQKNVWWGSLPGMFRSNIVPPILGFDSLDELLAHGCKKGDDADVSDELVSAQ